jgi:hypothetical protein
MEEAVLRELGERARGEGGDELSDSYAVLRAAATAMACAAAAAPPLACDATG